MFLHAVTENEGMEDNVITDWLKVDSPRRNITLLESQIDNIKALGFTIAYFNYIIILQPSLSLISHQNMVG